VTVAARVVVLAGPSGSGKSRLAQRLGLPVLRLDDFYKDGDDATLPRIATGSNAGLVDWDDPESWLCDEAVAALAALCRDGTVEVPVYSIPLNGRSGSHTLTLDGRTLVVAEGIFAAEVVAPIRSRGLLAAAYCLRQHPVVTFWRRLTRDLREHRKPPLVLVRRGLALMRDQRRVVASAVARGCVAVSPDEAYNAIRAMAPARDPSRRPSR
jgi:uridine kinase